jgi:hypothetical protein
VAGEHVVLKAMLRTDVGVFLKFGDERPSVLDGTASVYVSPGPCVTWLGP